MVDADEDESSLLEDTIDRVMGKGIVVDHSRRGFRVDPSEEASKASGSKASRGVEGTSQQEDRCRN